MARSLLIALLSVAAVAGPATAQVDPLAGLADLTEPPTDGLEEQGATLACSPLAAVACNASSALTCRPFKLMLDQTHWPGFSFEIDPDECIRRTIEDRIPPPVEIPGWLDGYTPAEGDAPSQPPATETPPADDAPSDA